MDGELTQFGAKGPNSEANNNCSPTSSFVSCFLQSILQLPFQYFPFNCDICGGNIGGELKHFTANDPN